MAALDPFYSPKRKIAVAREKTLELQNVLKAFIDSNPYSKHVEVDPKSGTQTHKIRLVQTIPERMRELAIETALALRASADQSGYASAILSGVKEPRLAAFPVADKAGKLKNAAGGKSKDLRAEIFDLFCGFEASKGGNGSIIWAMNKIANLDKHADTLLVPVGLAPQAFKFSNYSLKAPPDGGVGLRTVNWDPVKREMEIATIDKGGELKYDLKIPITVTFGDMPVVGGKPAIEVFAGATSVFERIVMATEAECRRLGLIK